MWSRFNAVRCLIFAILTVSGTPGLHAQERPLEEIGVITSVDTARSIITVDQRRLQITGETVMSSEGGGTRTARISKSWIGYQVAMETQEGGNTLPVITQIHFFEQQP